MENTGMSETSEEQGETTMHAEELDIDAPEQTDLQEKEPSVGPTTISVWTGGRVEGDGEADFSLQVDGVARVADVRRVTEGFLNGVGGSISHWEVAMRRPGDNITDSPFETASGKPMHTDDRFPDDPVEATCAFISDIISSHWRGECGCVQ